MGEPVVKQGMRVNITPKEAEYLLMLASKPSKGAFQSCSSAQFNFQEMTVDLYCVDHEDPPKEIVYPSLPLSRVILPSVFAAQMTGKKVKATKEETAELCAKSEKPEECRKAVCNSYVFEPKEEGKKIDVKCSTAAGEKIVAGGSITAPPLADELQRLRELHTLMSDPLGAHTEPYLVFLKLLADPQWDEKEIEKQLTAFAGTPHASIRIFLRTENFDFLPLRKNGEQDISRMLGKLYGSLFEAFEYHRINHPDEWQAAPPEYEKTRLYFKKMMDVFSRPVSQASGAEWNEHALYLAAHFILSIFEKGGPEIGRLYEFALEGKVQAVEAGIEKLLYDLEGTALSSVSSSDLESGSPASAEERFFFPIEINGIPVRQRAVKLFTTMIVAGKEAHRIGKFAKPILSGEAEAKLRDIEDQLSKIEISISRLKRNLKANKPKIEELMREKGELTAEKNVFAGNEFMTAARAADEAIGLGKTEGGEVKPSPGLEAKVSRVYSGRSLYPCDKFADISLDDYVSIVHNITELWREFTGGKRLAQSVLLMEQLNPEADPLLPLVEKVGVELLRIGSSEQFKQAVAIFYARLASDFKMRIGKKKSVNYTLQFFTKAQNKMERFYVNKLAGEEEEAPSVQPKMPEEIILLFFPYLYRRAKEMESEAFDAMALKCDKEYVSDYCDNLDKKRISLGVWPANLGEVDQKLDDIIGDFFKSYNLMTFEKVLDEEGKPVCDESGEDKNGECKKYKHEYRITYEAFMYLPPPHLEDLAAFAGRSVKNYLRDSIRRYVDLPDDLWDEMIAKADIRQFGVRTVDVTSSDFSVLVFDDAEIRKSFTGRLNGPYKKTVERLMRVFLQGEESADPLASLLKAKNPDVGRSIGEPPTLVERVEELPLVQTSFGEIMITTGVANILAGAAVGVVPYIAKSELEPVNLGVAGGGVGLGVTYLLLGLLLENEDTGEGSGIDWLDGLLEGTSTATALGLGAWLTMGILEKEPPPPECGTVDTDGDGTGDVCDDTPYPAPRPTPGGGGGFED